MKFTLKMYEMLREEVKLLCEKEFGRTDDVFVTAVYCIYNTGLPFNKKQYLNLIWKYGRDLVY